MKAVLSISMLVVGIVSFASQAQAQDSTHESAKQSESQEAFLPRGGWDGNNLRVSVSQSKLLKLQKQETNFGRGGWDANNLRISATQSKLIAAQKVETSVRGGGWDLNNLRVSASHSKLLGAKK
jgi:hypothetical protein